MREAYARGYADSEVLGVEVTVGIALRPGDDIASLSRHARFFAICGLGAGEGDHMKVVARVEELLEMKYPGRSYFVETEEDGKGVQIYDPRDFVKERCLCANRCTLLEAQLRALVPHVMKGTRD